MPLPSTPPASPSFAARVAALSEGQVAVVGLPWDEQSSFMRGAALAPSHIRDVLHDGSANLCTEHGADLAATAGWTDVGDVPLTSGPAVLAEIEGAIDALVERGARVLSLGGDHAVSYPVLRAYARAHPRLTVLHIDAHPDLYDQFEGSRLSHACPFARVMEERLVSRLVQVGIRTMTPHQREQATRFGVEVVEMRHWTPARRLELGDAPVYLSLDLDALDPACAPGVSHHEPGGFTTREVLGILHAIGPALVGADLVEFNPRRDVGTTTAMLAAKFYREIVGRLLADRARSAR
jgi:arginase